MRAGGRALIWL